MPFCRTEELRAEERYAVGSYEGLSCPAIELSEGHDQDMEEDQQLQGSPVAMDSSIRSKFHVGHMSHMNMNMNCECDCEDLVNYVCDNCSRFSRPHEICLSPKFVFSIIVVGVGLSTLSTVLLASSCRQHWEIQILKRRLGEQSNKTSSCINAATMTDCVPEESEQPAPGSPTQDSCKEEENHSQYDGGKGW